ncbi:MAG: hypothetical protein KatS3mg015_0001 [Fimbriimonadales bacterium]|nr:MAG: hypothetical protein KatS3mg015_0001 [Fimbriimonadales bacterium]
MLDLDRKDWVDILLGNVKVHEPIKFRTYSGTRVGDAHSTTMAIVLLVSDRLVQLWREHGFTGWDTFPVEVYAKDGSRVEGLHGLVVLGRSGPARRSDEDDPASGFVFDERTWDGSDMFVPEGTLLKCMSPRMAEATLAAKPKNVTIRRIEDRLI